MAGKCVMLCAKGWADCNLDPRDGCETQLGTDDNCGYCGNACGDGQTCTNGTCASS